MEGAPLIPAVIELRGWFHDSLSTTSCSSLMSGSCRAMVLRYDTQPTARPEASPLFSCRSSRALSDQNHLSGLDRPLRFDPVEVLSGRRPSAIGAQSVPEDNVGSRLQIAPEQQCHLV